MFALETILLLENIGYSVLATLDRRLFCWFEAELLFLIAFGFICCAEYCYILLRDYVRPACIVLDAPKDCCVIPVI